MKNKLILKSINQFRILKAYKKEIMTHVTDWTKQMSLRSVHPFIIVLCSLYIRKKRDYKPSKILDKLIRQVVKKIKEVQEWVDAVGKCNSKTLTKLNLIHYLPFPACDLHQLMLKKLRSLNTWNYQNNGNLDAYHLSIPCILLLLDWERASSIRPKIPSPHFNFVSAVLLQPL
jgi:hypothetical protein